MMLYYMFNYCMLLPSETQASLPGQVESRWSVSFVHHLDPEMIGQPENLTFGVGSLFTQPLYDFLLN